LSKDFGPYTMMELQMGETQKQVYTIIKA